MEIREVLIDPPTFLLYSEKENNRQQAIHELIQTESGFVEICQTLSQEIMLFGTTFLSALEGRQPQTAGALVQVLGGIMFDYIRGGEAFRHYCSN
ncbi:hypothetical protein PTTG_28534 [Puccinia triticina 1-1 BBBD Race 1]|uniref:DH domain-containing protein n=1 Tax=Puccinia triticina (isolate 1-1 / race 1 (BBBD)) TaxID=630390 RepID=A0A180GBB3_PUCT1|nr:hypothetical protein PTTG_28534 [Puccinia triticina 1-1 BBBD Race 1]